ncbi:hypothetical protein MRX96_035947 [Rhipicephalus microplus]
MDIDRMKRKRAVVRTSTTKLLNDIATMEDDASLGELEEKINLLTLKEDSLKELDREIEIGVEDDALEEEIACSENYKEKINVARTKVQLMLPAAVAGLDLSDGNYEVALSLLKERFGRKEAIIEDHMSRLLNIKSVRDSRNLSQLRSLVDEVERGVRSLTSLGVGVSTYGALLLTVVKKAVPADLHLEYCRRKGATTGGSELEAFAHFLRVEVEAREIIQRAETPRGMCVESSVENRNSTFKAARMSSAAALHTMTKERKGCLFCSSGCHESGDCDAEMSAADKREMLKRENRCFRCTVKGHTSRECRKAKWLRCANCSGKHLTAMCDPDFREYRGSGEQNASSPPATGQATVLKSSLGSEEKFMCMEGHQFLLQTARAWTVGPHKSTLVRLLLDGGSQRTFIHRKLSERLQLNVLGEEELKIYAFGDKSAITRTKARLVELWLQSQYDGKRARVEALEVPCICADIMAAPLKSVLLELSKFGLPVADVAQEQYAETANILRSHLYVDDLVTGVDTLEQGKVLCQESSDILSQAGMRLHKWMSNDHDLVNFIEDGNVAKRNANAELPAATKDKTHWPTTGEQSPGAVECHLEERKVTVMPVISSPFEAVLKVEEFSSCSRVVRLTAWVRRFVNNCRRGKERKGGPLRAEEVIDAERGARHLGVIARVVLDHPRAPGRKKGYQAVPHLSQTKLPSSHGTSGTTSS